MGRVCGIEEGGLSLWPWQGRWASPQTQGWADKSRLGAPGGTTRVDNVCLASQVCGEPSPCLTNESPPRSPRRVPWLWAAAASPCLAVRVGSRSLWHSQTAPRASTAAGSRPAWGTRARRPRESTEGSLLCRVSPWCLLTSPLYSVLY